MIGNKFGYSKSIFKVPTIDKFAVESCIKDEDGNTAHYKEFLGKTQKEWEDKQPSEVSF